ncbi:TlyA family RNA methyltransferase [Corynebacterium sp. MC-04]|uniref:TlyA family RNA methyltransferase n=1 Tax=Corynebacterium parakroppenstedtii TaxID=2828363 RepID=A0ABS9HK62_9CORY|nr:MULTISPECIES: TlyA family RNA methyltransferase [Corynebacterium]MDU3197849.1 TlyA family RNA methyltransferase [Corynebacterium kroppenstedtii]MBY0787593.1 TlyA family RNA methyltransferase [Corynebacterium parakroppenstedtii]MBY0791666.1 TlyA family RNA methyltransferase [Corynebacterium parakroppenstedtii]MCF6768619.1 TlyA family RNA methyltransferase [Corynebacterium parakroppenstedtii]MCF6771521.1 TlyA family RNA methyltransferase [Corynebacterium parakroppenstedtii]
MIFFIRPWRIPVTNQPSRRRLDAELVNRKVARSRDQAVEMIRSGRVMVNGFQATKPATRVDPGISIKVEKSVDDNWASRGAHKLLGACDAFEPEGLLFEGRRVLDAGASTGGFTDVCLKRGAREVVAVDVGYGQLIWRLQNDDRVRVVDRTNVRHLTPELTGGPCDLMVGDLSFISLKLVLPAIVECMGEGADLLPMVKPQFEVGKDRLEHGGVVRSESLRTSATVNVAQYAQTLGLSLRGVVASPLPGPSGNVEYFLWLVKDGGVRAVEPGKLESMVSAAVQEGPQ